MPASSFVHPMAVVEPGASLGSGVRIGPFCHVGADAVLGENVELVSHVAILGATTIGENTKVYPQAVLGGPPQNRGHKGGRTTLTIGKNCTIREGVTMHLGTDNSRGATVVGDNGNFLAYAHVAHDCIVGDNCTFANGATLGGHCDIGDNVNIGGLTAVHQFVRVGNNAFLGGCSAVMGDVIPFGIVQGNRAKLRGFNLVGMKRSGMPRAEIYALRKAYRVIFNPEQVLSDNLERAAEQFADSPMVMSIIDFMNIRGKRHFTVPPLGAGGGDKADDED